eukprot:TRINITY_DN8187_c0_g1_i5.p2 TRINITY_DN8187_c0_g1~~TRINITY_DN8187_c0_g1_i5.p2  ORF type:complete len:115 (-),score=32.88 TRINITY_DN8187_c0_g1_i5:324-668(-)
MSFLKEQAIKFGMVKKRIAGKIGKLIKENLQAQALAEDLQKAFVSVFNRDSAFRTRWRNQRKEVRNRIGVLANLLSLAAALLRFTTDRVRADTTVGRHQQQRACRAPHALMPHF